VITSLKVKCADVQRGQVPRVAHLGRGQGGGRNCIRATLREVAEGRQGGTLHPHQLFPAIVVTETAPSHDTVTAALVIIGAEILSGRTRDENITHIARYLNDIGIALQEVRVVRDVEAEIAAAVNELRARYSYVFTTGGIGPTHDDVTTDAIAKAFGAEVAVDPRAVEAMRKGYSELELTPARLRMARIPNGAELVDNPVSRAPGFMLGNVIVMAGIPRIMQVMLDAVAPLLKKGRPMLSRSVRIEVPEGDVATGLTAIQAAHADVQIGSYPFFEKGRLGTYVVLRSVDAAALDLVLDELWELIAKEKFKAFGDAEA